MSRVGKMPIAVPKGVDVTAGEETSSGKGGLGTLSRPVNPLVAVQNEDGKRMLKPANASTEAAAR